MNGKLYLYVRSLDGRLGGPLFSTLDLFRLLSGESDVVIVSRQRRGPATSSRLADLGVPERNFMTVSEFFRSTEISTDDVLHLQHVFDPLVAVIGQFGRAKGLTVVLSPRGALDDWSMSQKRLKKRVAERVLGRALWRRVDTIHCTAEREASQVKGRLGSSVATAVVPNVVSHAWNLGLCSVEAQPGALYLSRVHEKKRPDLAIKGVASLLRERRLSHLTIAGSGDEQMLEDLKQLAIEERIENFVRFSGHIDEQGCLEAYQSHEIFLLPTSQENFGRVLFEAISFGLAVFVPDQVDTWPELESLGATAISQNELSIQREVSAHLERELPMRRLDVERRSKAARDFLRKESLIQGYESMYSDSLRRSV